MALLVADAQRLRLVQVPGTGQYLLSCHCPSHPDSCCLQAFCLFFVLIAVTSDMICFLFIPVHWLFFAASTYVWVQYVWHTERGICLPTVSLWLLFVYIEASVRLKELKSPSASHHLDLCRPFAAHCIGYPVVTLGFGFKSYVSYRMRLRKQREVAKENEFFVDLLHQALPKECVQLPAPQPAVAAAPPVALENHMSSPVVVTANGHHPHHQLPAAHNATPQTTSPNGVTSNGSSLTCRKSSSHSPHTNGSLPIPVTACLQQQKQQPSPQSPQQQSQQPISQSTRCNSEYDAKKTGNEKQELHFEKEYMEQQIISPKKVSNVNDFDEEADFESGSHKNSFKNCISLTTSATVPPAGSSSLSATPASKWSAVGNQSNVITLNSSAASSNNSHKKRSDKSLGIANNLKDTATRDTDSPHQRLEADIKRLKADLQASRQTEQELRAQISGLLNRRAEEDRLRGDVMQLQRENESLQSKVTSLQSARVQDKQNLSQLEKKVQEEKKLKAGLESQLKQEQEKKKKDQEQKEMKAAAAVAAAAAATRLQQQQQQLQQDCSESCRCKRREMENDLKMLKRELKLKEERLHQAERETQSLRQYKDSHGDTEILMSALSAMQEKNAHLEHSLSAETRLKLDLFSALGDTKRQLEISQALMAKKEKEAEELKSKVAEVMACMPNTYSLDSGNSLVSSILFNSKFLGHDSSSREVQSDL